MQTGDLHDAKKITCETDLGSWCVASHSYLYVQFPRLSSRTAAYTGM
jgi:hypothetical protein